MKNTMIKSKYKGGLVEKNTARGWIADIIVWILLIGVILVCFLPFWHVIMASISDGQTLMAESKLLVLPVGTVNLKGYAHVFSDNSILTGYLYTIIYVVGATILGFVLNVLAGYVLSRKTKLRKPFTMIVMFTMMFSGGLIPTYMVLRSLSFLNTPLAIIIPGCTNAFFIMISKTAFESVSESIIEAARIDGAGHIRVMLGVSLPLCMGGLTVVILYSVINQWNSWFPASIYLTNAPEIWPLQLHIKEMIGSNNDFLGSTNPDYSRYLIQYALIVVATLPIIIAFPFFQRFLEKGAIVGGVKE